MCGIYGVIRPSGEVDEALQIMDRALEHRGPDGRGLVRLPHAVLGHRRLSIIDLSEAAAQPLKAVDADIWLTYNGEIYNAPELRVECEEAGLQFRSHSDTEVIVASFLLHGVASFARLDGMFAFCLVDGRTNEAFLVRDPMGIKPLYYAATDRGLFFASELGALLDAAVVPFAIDRAALQAYLQLDYVPAPMSMIRGVRKLVGGEVLRSGAEGSISIRTFQALEAEARVGSFDDDLRELDVRLRAAVRRQLVADVPVGVLLSGGLDSSIVAQAAVEESGSRVTTFSIGFEQPTFDERRYFLEVAGHLDTDHQFEVLDARAMLDLLPSVAAMTSEPLADGSILPTALLSRFTRRSVKVALSGDGADELFGGYPTYRVQRLGAIASRAPRLIRDAAFRAAGLLRPTYENFSLDFKTRKFLGGLHRDPVLRHERWLGSFVPEDLPELLPCFDAEAQVALEDQLRAVQSGRLGLEKLLRTDQRFYLQDQVLVKVDRASMASSLEVRVPFLDHEIVTFARALPHDRKVKGRDFKHILKRYAETRLPESVVKRQKKGFGAPLGAWFRGELRDFVSDSLAPEKIAGLFHPEPVGRLLDEHFSGRIDHRKLIFNLLTFVLWCDRYAS
jgi:asparagine synthase (glutamine-hydrolysing)